jgi:hypothetical protein
MKKQSSMHRSNPSIQPETTAATFLGSARQESYPKGLHAGDRGKPTHLDAGAAESHTRPVEMPHRADTASASAGRTNTGTNTGAATGSSRQTNMGAGSRPGAASGPGSSRTGPR